MKKCFAAESEGFFVSARTRNEGEFKEFVEVLGRQRRGEDPLAGRIDFFNGLLAAFSTGGWRRPPTVR